MARFLFFDDQIINIFRKAESPSGGAAVQAYGWIMGLTAAGHEVYVMTNTRPNEDLKEGCHDIRLVPMYDRQKGVRWLRWIYYRLPFLFNRIREVRPGYVYQGVPRWTSFLLGIICWLLRIKLVIRISNDFIVDERLYNKFSKFYGFFQNLGLRMAHCILCQNEYQYQKIKSKFPRKLVVRISNPVYQKYQGEIAKPLSRNYIAWVGIFQYQKNLAALFEIASAIPDQVFKVAGKEDPKCDADTRRYLHKLQALHNVQFVGFLNRERVLSFVAGSKYLLNTSHYEGFSNTFLEAMSAGTPILTSINVNPDRIVSEHGLGIVYNDTADLVFRLSAVPISQYETISANVLAYVARNHDCYALSSKLVEHLEGRAAPAKEVFISPSINQCRQ